MRLKNKTALITGAASGYGAGIAKRFAQEGANVMIADIDERNGRAVGEQINSAGGRASFVKVDVSKAPDVANLLAAALQTFGSADIVVNNAGTTYRRKPVHEVTEAEFDRVIAVNVKSILLSAVVMVPHFRSHGGGVFVNIASTVSFRPSTGLAFYNASKAAVVSISKTMAMELGPDNIRVNCVNPGAGETGLLADFFGETIKPDMLERYVNIVPLRRLTTAEDVANACLYLASDESKFVTGATLNVDGGKAI
jgi:3-oxoacyl-[acyl-carrier protein] reductase